MSVFFLDEMTGARFVGSQEELDLRVAIRDYLDITLHTGQRPNGRYLLYVVLESDAAERDKALLKQRLSDYLSGWFRSPLKEGW